MMNEILKFIKLDFITFKNAVGYKVLVPLLFVVVLYFFCGLVALAGMLPLLLPTLTTQIFGAGNDGLDLFYASLHLKRKNVVLARYAFIILINTIILVLLFALSFLETGDLEPRLFLMQVLSILFVTTMIDFFNAPVLFKLGFKKGKIIVATLPIILMLGAFLYLHFGGISLDGDVAELMNEIQGPGINPLIALIVWVMLLATSIFLSLKFYAEREL